MSAWKMPSEIQNACAIGIISFEETALQRETFKKTFNCDYEGFAFEK